MTCARMHGSCSIRSNLWGLPTHLQTTTITRPNRIFNHCSEFSILQLVNCTCCCACWTCYTIPKYSRMLASFHGELCTPQKCMIDKSGSRLAGKTHMNSCVDHGFHQKENVGRSWSRDGRWHINKWFVVNKDCLSERIQHTFDLLSFICVNVKMLRFCIILMILTEELLNRSWGLIVFLVAGHRYCFVFYMQLSLLRFFLPYADVLQAEDQANKFFFYEVYKDAAAIAHHKEQPHYAAWNTFKESGGTISSLSKKASGKFMTQRNEGSWDPCSSFLM